MKGEHIMPNKWYVVTGGPHSGKTKCLKILSEMGYRTLPEAARVYIDDELVKGRTIEEIRKNERAFQNAVLKMKEDIEKKMPKREVIIFDRGIPDTMAYFRAYGWSTARIKKIMKGSRYRKVFLLEMYGYKKDYARTESAEQAKKIHDLLKQAYEELGIPVVEVPNAKQVEKKAEFILQHLS